MPSAPWPGRSRGSSRGRPWSGRRSRASGPGGRCPSRGPPRGPGRLARAISTARRTAAACPRSPAAASRLPAAPSPGRAPPRGVPTSKIDRMFGWFRAAAARASCSKRPRRSGVVGEGLRQDLDRHVPSEPRVAGAVDLAHPAGADQAEDLVGAEPCAGREWHGPSAREESRCKYGPGLVLNAPSFFPSGTGGASVLRITAPRRKPRGDDRQDRLPLPRPRDAGRAPEPEAWCRPGGLRDLFSLEVVLYEMATRRAPFGVSKEDLPCRPRTRP